MKELDFMTTAVNDLTKTLNNKLDEILIEGLKEKGFEFDNRHDLIEFIQYRCSCEDMPDKKERVYYVDDKPFLLHNYESSFQFEGGETNKITGTYGSYALL